jgi:large-conductance mechanosensitive channel
MSVNFIGNFKFMGVIIAIFIFMLIIYGYNKAEKRKLAKPVQQQQPITEEQQQAMAAYKHPSFARAAKKGCGCGAKK